MIARAANLLYALGLGALVVISLPRSTMGILGNSLLIVAMTLWILGAVALCRNREWGLWVSLLFLLLPAMIAVRLFATGVGLKPIAGDPTDGIGFMVILGGVGSLLTSPVLIGLALQLHVFRRNRAVSFPGADSGLAEDQDRT